MSFSQNQFDESKVRRDGAIARVDLNRPDEGNAMTRGMMVQLADTFLTYFEEQHLPSAIEPEERQVLLINLTQYR